MSLPYRLEPQQQSLQRDSPYESAYIIPLARYSAGADLKVRLTCFELYVKELGTAENQWTKELLLLLEDDPFRMVTQLGLVLIH